MGSTRKRSLILAVTAAAFLIAAAPRLYTSPTEAKWAVLSGGKTIANVTVITDGESVRAEWKPASGATVTFIGTNNKLWARSSGGDVEYSAHRGGVEKPVLPALMLPYTTTAADKVESKGGKVTTYSFGGSSASYKYDKTGPSQIDVTSGGTAYTLTRSSSAAPKVADASIFTVRPRKGAATQISRLAGDLFGASDTKVSATAGARGVDVVKLDDGGDYDAVQEIENRDAERKAKMDEALREFQKEGKVGQAREEGR